MGLWLLRLRTQKLINLHKKSARTSGLTPVITTDTGQHDENHSHENQSAETLRNIYLYKIDVILSQFS